MHRASMQRRSLLSQHTTRHHKSTLQRTPDTSTHIKSRHRRQNPFNWPRCRLARARGSAYGLAVRARGSHRMHMYIYGAMCAHVLVRARARPSWPPVARARAFELIWSWLLRLRRLKRSEMRLRRLRRLQSGCGRRWRRRKCGSGGSKAAAGAAEAAARRLWRRGWS